jgi:heme/copper-type cytochrome/quinol oxidase subunit 3
MDWPMKPDEFAVLMILVGVSAVVSLLTRVFTRSFIRAAVMTAVLVSAGVQVYLARQGYNRREDKFALLVLLYPAAVGFAVTGAVHVALHMWAYRRKGRRLEGSNEGE